MVFLPRTDFGAQETCRTIVETEVLRMGYYIYGWRQVPVDVSCLGEKANATRPEIEQIMIANSQRRRRETFERELYSHPPPHEKARASAGQRFYICSLSCRSIIYKGMMLAEQVAVFYPDLMDERLKALLRSITSAIRPTPSRSGGWRSRSACSRTMARSTR